MERFKWELYVKKALGRIPADIKTVLDNTELLFKIGLEIKDEEEMEEFNKAIQEDLENVRHMCDQEK